MHDIVAIGELLIDFTPNGTNEQGMNLFACNPGGAPANVLVMNAKLGGTSAFIGKVGEDQFGTFLQRVLQENYVDTMGLLRDPTVNTTLAFVHLNGWGDRSFSFYRKAGADCMLTGAEVNRKLVSGCRVLHFGSVSLTHQPSRDAVFETVDFAMNQRKIISFDPNYRPLLWENEECAKAQILRAIPLANILKVSEEEMVLLTGQTDLQAGAKQLMDMGPNIVMVSLGAQGACFQCTSGFGMLPAYDVKTVDTTGAGDAFWGAVLYRLHKKERSQLQTIKKEEITDILDFANASGSLTTTRKGAIPALPSIEEIERCRKECPYVQPQ